MKFRRSRSVMAAVLLGALTLGACGGSDDGAADGGAGGATREAGPAARSEEFAQLDSGAGDEARTAARLPTVGPSIIKTGHLSVEVKRGNFNASVQRVIAVAERFGGFVLTTTVEDSESGYGSVVLRVPNEDFEAAIAELEGLGEVTSQTLSGQDVTEEFVDLQARLRHAKAQEAVMLKLMARARTISDTIAVQNQLSNLQLEIERLEGRLRFLEDRTSLATITVDLNEAGAAPGKSGALGKAWRQAGEGFVEVIATLIIATGFIVPLALIGAVIVLLVRLLLPRFAARAGARETT